MTKTHRCPRCGAPLCDVRGEFVCWRCSLALPTRREEAQPAGLLRRVLDLVLLGIGLAVCVDGLVELGRFLLEGR